MSEALILDTSLRKKTYCLQGSRPGILPPVVEDWPGSVNVRSPYSPH